MNKRMVTASLAVLFLSAVAFSSPTAKKAAASKSASMTKTYYATVTDSNCGLKHSTASAAAAACVEKCVAGGAKYALVYHGKLYQAEPQDKFKDLGGKRVKISGNMANGTITAETVKELAGPSKHAAKKKAS